MNLIIKIWNNVVTISLMDKKKTLDRVNFALEHNLSEKMLPEIDQMLRRHKLMPKDIKKADFKTNIKNSYTTVRIGKVVARAFNWTKSQK